MKKIITIEIEEYPELPDGDKYLAVIREGEYKNIVVGGTSVSDCFKEIATSIFILDDYRKNHSNEHK